MEFKDLGLSEPVADALHRKGFQKPTPIQEQAIPPLMQGRDLMGRAETGSGKTLAFGIPLIERVESQRVSIQALVVCPTRELAQQVADDLTDVGREKGTKVALVVGGVHVRTQRMGIPGKQIVVGTPGRIIDLLEDRFLPVEWVEYFVLDEFDRLLDMGFLDDIKRIVKRLPKERQTALFSATVPPFILREAQKLLNNPVQIQIGSSRKAVETIDQRAVRTKSARKLAILEKLLKYELDHDGTVIVFCNTKRAVRQVDRELWAKQFSVAALSGDHEQSVRFKVMERFRNQEIRVLVATDVAARGLDIDHIGHVINFDAPFETEDYVHRIGRTARAGRDGVVTTLVGDEDYQAFERIRQHLDQDISMIAESQCVESLEKRGPRAKHVPVQEVIEAEVETKGWAEGGSARRGDDRPAPEAGTGFHFDDEEVEPATSPAREERGSPRDDRPTSGRSEGRGRDDDRGRPEGDEDGDPRRRRRRRSRRDRGETENRNEEDARQRSDEGRRDRGDENGRERGDDGRGEASRRDRGHEDRNHGREEDRREREESSSRRGRDDERSRDENRSGGREGRDDDRDEDRPRRSRRGRRGRGRGRDEQRDEDGQTAADSRTRDREDSGGRRDRGARDDEGTREGSSRPDRSDRSDRNDRNDRNGRQDDEPARRERSERSSRSGSDSSSSRGDDREGRGSSRRGRSRSRDGEGRSRRGDSSERRRSGSDSNRSSRSSSRDGKSGNGEDRDARGRRRRSRHDYQRWEEEQLNRPIGLIEDGRQVIEDRSDRSRGRGEDNDNAPAPFVPSETGPAEASSHRRDDDRARRGGRGRSRRSSGRDSERGSRRRDSGSDSKPDSKRNDDIVW